MRKLEVNFNTLGAAALGEIYSTEESGGYPKLSQFLQNLKAFLAQQAVSNSEQMRPIISKFDELLEQAIVEHRPVAAKLLVEGARGILRIRYDFLNWVVTDPDKKNLELADLMRAVGVEAFDGRAFENVGFPLNPSLFACAVAANQSDKLAPEAQISYVIKKICPAANASDWGGECRDFYKSLLAGTTATCLANATANSKSTFSLLLLWALCACYFARKIFTQAQARPSAGIKPRC